MNPTAPPEPAGLLHELTKHGPAQRPRGLVEFVPLDPANRPEPFKRYPGLPTHPLPTGLGMTGVPAADVLSGRAKRAEAPLDELTLARLLFFSAGVTRTAKAPGGRVWFRAAMSAGNLHPVEVYVVAADLPGVPAGVHHFAPLELGLTSLRGGDWRAHLAGAAAELGGVAPVYLVLTGIPWRTGWKYGERGWRHLYWDAGTMLANLLVMANAHGLPARVLVGFVEAEVARLVGVDGVQEFPVAVVAVGRGAPAPPSSGEPPPLTATTAALSPRPLVFPLVTEAQRAGDLPDAGAVTAWRSAAEELGERAGGDVDVPGGHSLPIEEIILRRGSTRRMRREPVAKEMLTWGMGVATRPVPADCPSEGRTLLQHLLTAHAVAGVEPAAGRWQAGIFHPTRRGDFRAAAQQLCLGQPLGGDSAYTAVHCADLDPILRTLRSRGYRAAQLEAGVAAERLALAAFILGAGATGLTFFDDLVSAFFSTSAACMLVTAVGVPAYRSRPGGGPDRPTELVRFDRPTRPSRQL
ncbi:MAG: SagB family peptide dehydrogenase [Actinomycetota bacterium]|nr:SagB family peptide dehydrogenase [Actinomycetota bacterium]